jgi:hypothetical protein
VITSALAVLDQRKLAAWGRNGVAPALLGLGSGLLGGALFGHLGAAEHQMPHHEVAADTASDDAAAFYADRDVDMMPRGLPEHAGPAGPALPHALDPYIHDGKPGWLPPVTSPNAVEILNRYGTLPDSAKVTAVETLTNTFDPQHTGHPTIDASSAHAPETEHAIRDALNEQGGRYSFVPNSTIDAKIHEGLQPIWPVLDKTTLPEERQLSEVLQAHARSLPEYQAMQGKLHY